MMKTIDYVKLFGLLALFFSFLVVWLVLTEGHRLLLALYATCYGFFGAWGFIYWLGYKEERKNASKKIN